MREESKVLWRVRTSGIRGVDAWSLVRGLVLLLACALLATGCATAVAYRAPVAGPQTACVTCAEHVRQLGGESPFGNLMEVKS